MVHKSFLFSSIFLFLFLLGCTEINTTNNQSNTSPSETTIVVEEELYQMGLYMTIHKIMAGDIPLYFFYNNTRASLLNCGEEIYSPMTINKIKKILKDNEDLIFNDLIITNTSKKYLGACKEIIIDFPDLRKVQIYDYESYGVGYEDIIFWVPNEKLIIDEDYNFTINFNGVVIDLDKLYPVTETNGTKYEVG